MPYYLSRIKFATDGPKGGVKWNREQYLVNAVSITHAETLINQEFSDTIVEFEVAGISESKIVKIIDKTKTSSDGDV
tara:strand:+ start:115 stop:345 length:231 start_codon:yes stop_codon:yes gene_type:complete